MASHTARTLTDHIGTEQQHRDALTRWDPEKYKRVDALTYAGLGDSLAAQARAEEAVAAWAQALTLMAGMTSDRTRKVITSLRSALAHWSQPTSSASSTEPGASSPNGFLTVVFATHEWTGEPENREPRKHAQVCWVDADAIPEEFVDTTADALHRYLSNGPQVSLDDWR